MQNTINAKYVMFLGITAALAGLMFGFDIAIITGAGPFLKTQFNLTELSLGLAFSSLLFGCALGSLVMGYLADRFGRREPLIWVAVLFGITSLATGLAPSFTLFLVARFLGGLAVGGASILAPMYVAEVAPPSLRGRMCASYQMSIVIGILISFLLNYLLQGLPPWAWFNATLSNLGEWNWRWMFISGVIPSIVFFFLVLKAPETPRYLYKCGREREALAILERISGQAEAEFEMKEIRVSLERPKASWKDLKNPGLRRALTVGFVLAVLVHFSGINTIIDYAPIILKSAQFKIDAALFATFGIGIVNFLFTLVSFWTIDRFGRKPLYIIGSLGMAIVAAHAGGGGDDRPLHGRHRAHPDPQLHRLLRLVHRTGLLDAGARNLPEPRPQRGDDRARHGPMDRQRHRRALLPLGSYLPGEGPHLPLPLRHGPRANALYLALRPGNQGQDPRRDRIHVGRPCRERQQPAPPAKPDKPLEPQLTTRR